MKIQSAIDKLTKMQETDPNLELVVDLWHKEDFDPFIHDWLEERDLSIEGEETEALRSLVLSRVEKIDATIGINWEWITTCVDSVLTEHFKGQLKI